jgi:hypothetical protein
MPRLDAYIPEEAHSRGTETDLLARLTDALLEHEGVARRRSRCLLRDSDRAR